MNQWSLGPETALRPWALGLRPSRAVATSPRRHRRRRATRGSSRSPHPAAAPPECRGSARLSASGTAGSLDVRLRAARPPAATVQPARHGHDVQEKHHEHDRVGGDQQRRGGDLLGSAEADRRGIILSTFVCCSRLRGWPSTRERPQHRRAMTSTAARRADSGHHVIGPAKDKRHQGVRAAPRAARAS